MTYPIIEYDSPQEAMIEPSKVIKNRGLPEHCVIYFFKPKFQGTRQRNPLILLDLYTSSLLSDWVHTHQFHGFGL